MSTVLPCTTCGGRGPASGDPCPDCGVARKKLNLALLTPEQVDNFVTASGRLGIPPEYIGLEWNPETFWTTQGEPQGGREGSSLESFVNALYRIHSIFAEGKVPGGSAMVFAPSGFSKATWAFSCMALAQKHGYSVAPFFDTAEANRILTVTSQVPNFSYYGKLTMEDYITKDVLFVGVAKSYLGLHSAPVILDLLSKRSRKGLPTFITSSLGFNQLASADPYGNFVRLKDIKGGENKLKVPMIVSYKI